ncbi:MAG: NAD(P)/FAD-dependent oxidoreductase, partial [bacterium]|nr:NAD(P)/FAD-dependent oxidoreductase [bacterium]
AIIVGGGNKALFLAMYLIKYGGMSVGIFERRHEIGGCLATEEISAPGFRGNTHANIILPWYYLPVCRDFPEFWEYGAQWDQYLCSDGFVFRDNETCLAIYSDKHDPTQERTIREIARFSEKDAQKWGKITELEQSDEYQICQMDMIFLPAEARMAPEIMERQMELYPKLIEADMEPDSLTLAASPYRTALDWFESPELQSCILRLAVTGATDITEPGNGIATLGMATSLSTVGFNRGGTHMVAHAAHQILNQIGCEFHINKEVEKVIIENGTATGIRLDDGTEIEARKLVVSTLSPNQLIFDLIGEENVEDKLARRVAQIENTFGCIMWYSLAVHEAPQYKAAAFNPDINETEWLGLQPDPDPIHIARECRNAKLLKWPPPSKDDYCNTVWCNSLVDPSYAPDGKHVVQNEQLGPPATLFTEKEWIEVREQFAKDLMELWEDYAPNMTWDNVIGVDKNT